MARYPLSMIKDYGYNLQISYMVVPKKVCLYGINSYFFDEFKRNPWEFGGGVNFYPIKPGAGD